MVQIQFGVSTIRQYKRLPYTHWHALAEFVDNSTQAYFNNRQVLDEHFERIGEGLEVVIVYDKDSGVIRITDNSMGMSEAELEDALKVGHPPRNTTGRSEFGMGMKTAACWFGDLWKIRTKRLGETEEIAVTVDVEKVAAGHSQLPTFKVPGKDPEEHYTLIEITQLHRRFQQKTMNRVKRHLQSMYRRDLQSGTLDLRVFDTELSWDESDDRFAKSFDGKPYKKDFSFDVNGKPVAGFIGILDFGHGGREYAGITILRRNRVIKGYPDAWRPSSVFGQDTGSNDLINQRIVGEINVDDFQVSHTKDDIHWDDDELYIIEDELAKLAQPYAAIAKSRRKNQEDTASAFSELEVQAAVAEIQTEISSDRMVDFVTIVDVPPPSVIDQINDPVTESVKGHNPDFFAQMNHLTIKGFIQNDGSPNDPYVTIDSPDQESVTVIVNMKHPYIGRVGRGSEGLADYFRHCTYDAVAEWKAQRSASKISSDTVKYLKDSLLRLPLELEMDNSSIEIEQM